MMASPSAQPTRRQLRDFGLLIGVVLPFLIGWLLPALHGHPFRAWTLWPAIPALSCAVLAPRLLAWPYRGWMALGHALGWVNGHLILGAVFVLVLQPIALLMRLCGYDPLRRRRSTDLSSYREPRQVTASNLTRVF
jgi:hypothetical protein